MGRVLARLFRARVDMCDLVISDSEGRTRKSVQHFADRRRPNLEQPFG